MSTPPRTPRRIYVDHTHLRGHITGIERVALDLFAPEALRPHTVRPLRSRSVPHMIAAQHLGLPTRALADPSALFVFPGFPPGPLSVALGQRCLIYVHDTFLLTRPADLSWKSRLYMAPSFAFAMRFGQRFLVNSRTTGEAVRAVCASSALVALLRPAVRDVFGLADLPEPATYMPGEPLRLLSIGTIEPRKDYPAAIALVAALNAAGVPAELHVVGRVGWGRHDFLAAPPSFLTLHGYVDDSGLRALVGRCHLLLSTSKAEGLGLPLLEVQHGGLPVVAPIGPVFAEVLGQSALFITPEAPEAAAADLIAFVGCGRLGPASQASRANVARWNGLAAQDAARFRRFLSDGPAAYADDPEAVIAP
ncbi:glycosyltransferase family 4 protein [Methylobacterium sp. BTF04]|uniref:glycosyltransferase n=1 Tax=Methylobacterium sp. BTF04 TaxID=2708300 RepID=UPI0013D35B36|nr:glycosyltransferase [Methylobacterium sp. BTF04]NEU13406.1 glycosyltransferase family 4 protein [Methylobacterium sp. BTF04]